MKDALEKAITHVATLASETKSADEALKFTQSACNAMNALACLSNIKK